MLLLLLLLATLLVATVYCLLYVCEHGELLLAIHIPERLVAACYLLWTFLTKYKTCQETWHFRLNLDVIFVFVMNREHVKFFFISKCFVR